MLKRLNKKTNLIKIFFLFFLFSIIFISPYEKGDTLKSATEYDYPPFSITDSGKAEGFSVELLTETLKSQGYEVSFYIDEWTTIKKELEIGNLDVLPLVGRTPEREEIYDFTVPYITLYGGIFTRNTESITSLKQAKGKVFLTLKGDNSEEFILRENLSDKIISTNSFEEAFIKLNNGQGDLIIAQESVGLKIIEDNNLKNVKFSTRINEFKQDFTFAVKKGNSELLSILNEGLSKIISNEKYDEIYEKWLKEDESSLTNLKDFEYAKDSIQQKSQDVAKQIEIYLRSNPEMTVKDLQNDEYFQSIALQKVGKTGYTSITNQDTSEQLFHPQEEMIGKELREFKEVIPELWEFFESELLGQCNNAGVFYTWPDPQGNIREKYAYSSCIPIKTADGVYLGVDASAYIDEYSKDTAPKESVEELAVQLIAKELSKEIELFIQKNPKLTLEELLKNKEFEKISLARFGDKGYSFIMDSNNGEYLTHPRKDIVGSLGKEIGSISPESYEIIKRAIGPECKDSDGFYEWVEQDGSKEDKYAYLSCIDEKTSDGKSLLLVTTAYLDEELPSQIKKLLEKETTIQEKNNFNFPLIFLLILGIFIYILIIVTLKPEREENSKLKLSILLTSISGIILLIAHTLNNFSFMNNHSTFLFKIIIFSSYFYIFNHSLSYMIAAEKKIPDKKYFLLFALHGAVAILTFFTNLVVKEVVIPSESQTQFIINEFVRGPSFIWIIGLMIFFSLFALFLTSKEIFLKKTKNNLFIGLGYLLSFFLLIYLIITESTDASNSPIIAFQLFPILTAALMGLIFYSVGILKKKKKTFMIVLTLFLILIMSVFGFNNYQTTKDIEEIIIDQEISALIAISQSRANHVETYMEQNIEKLKLITSRNKLRETAYSYILQKTPEKVETMNGILTSAKNSVQEIERVCVINLQGEIISSTNNSFIGKNVLEKEFFKKGLEKESIFFVEENGVLKIFTTGPIIFNKEKIGVGLMVVKTNYLKNIITNREGFGETGEVLIAIEDKKTGKINFLFERLFEEETANIKETNKTSALMKNTLEKRETSLSSDDLDYRNKKVLAASQFIELGEMGLITKRDFEEIDSQLKNESKKLWIQTIGILILLIVIAIISNFLINRSLKKEVKEKTAELDKNVGNLKDTKNALLNMMEDMDKANQDLKKLDKAKSEFLNITSHELKTPLTAMMAYIEILEDSKEKLNKTEKESLETIKRNAHNLKKLIGNILEIARMESGKFELIKTEINLKETVFEAIEDIKILAEKKGLEIVTKIDEKIPTLMMDQERVKEIVNNLVSNSVKFTEKGKITISAKKKAESIELIIEDTGKGIPKENLENLFKLFYQVDASISRKHEGTGLGLAITKKIVEAHGGEIKVESEANKGTKFIINFPLEKIKLK